MFVCLKAAAPRRHLGLEADKRGIHVSSKYDEMMEGRSKIAVLSFAMVAERRGESRRCKHRE